VGRASAVVRTNVNCGWVGERVRRRGFCRNRRRSRGRCDETVLWREFCLNRRRWVIGATKPTRPPAPQPLYPAPLTFAGIQTTARR
jgi:hypothetical protein